MAVDGEFGHIRRRQRERELERVPRIPTPTEFLADMSQSEMKSVILEMFDQLRDLRVSNAEKDRKLDEKDRLIDSLNEKLDTVLANQRQQRIDHESWVAKERIWNEKEASFKKIISDLNDVIKVLKKEKFQNKSQKSRRGKDGKGDGNGNGQPSAQDPDLAENKEGFDGRDPDGSVAAAADKDVKDIAPAGPSKTRKEVVPRPYRHGITYNRMSADRTERHYSSRLKMPEGAKFIRFGEVYSYEQVTTLTEHVYQTIVYKHNGKIYEVYLPAEGEPEYIDRVPGTKGSADFMAYLTYDRYYLHTPLYREVQRLLDEKMRLSRQTLGNWLYRVSLPARRIVDALLEQALCEDAIVNVDETWVRVKDDETNKYKKKYTWCLVNKRERIVIYHYDNGSRGRKVLKKLIGDHKIKALQSDGYNVYLYLDNQLVDIEHLCCLAHTRAKFKYAADQGDKEARFFVDKIGELYGLEDLYRQLQLEPEDIEKARNNGKTSEILGDIYNRLVHLRKKGHAPRSELMDKALNYMFTYWKQLTAWRKDGRYDIDNTLAERYIRPLSGERKNSLFFGSQEMAVVSATFHTLLATCRARGISRLNYLKDFFRGLVQGRADYENMLPCRQSCVKTI